MALLPAKLALPGHGPKPWADLCQAAIADAEVRMPRHSIPEPDVFVNNISQIVVETLYNMISHIYGCWKIGGAPTEYHSSKDHGCHFQWQIF